MANLEIETRKIINEFYNNLISETDKAYKDYCENMKAIDIEKFNNDARVDIINDYFKALKRDFPKLELDLRCDVYKYCCNYNCNDTEEYQHYIKVRNEIINDKRKLILILESNPKKSEEYKKAMSSFMNLLNKEENYEQ